MVFIIPFHSLHQFSARTKRCVSPKLVIPTGLVPSCADRTSVDLNLFPNSVLSRFRLATALVAAPKEREWYKLND